MTTAASKPMSTLLRPLQLVDIPRIYSENALVIDFVLYLVLFNGLAQVALARRLEGRGGRLVAGAVGTSLALALTGLEARTGFTLASVGSLAAGLLLLLVGVTIHRTLRHLGASGVTAGALSLVVVALGVESTAPRLAATLSDSFPFVDLAVAVGLLALAWKGIQHLAPSGSGERLVKLADKVEGSGQQRTPPRVTPEPARAGGEVEHLRGELRLEKPEITRHLKRITKKERKSCKQVRKELESIRTILQRGRLSESDRREIAEALRRIPPERRQLAEMVAAVKSLDLRLARFEVGVLKELQQAWEKVPPAQRPVVRRLALEEREKVGSERRIAAVEEFISTYDQQAAQLLDRAVTALVNGSIPEAIGLVQAAEQAELEAEKKVEEILQVEQELRKIVRLELRQARRAA